MSSYRGVRPERAQRGVGLDATLYARIRHETARKLHQQLVRHLVGAFRCWALSSRGAVLRVRVGRRCRARSRGDGRMRGMWVCGCRDTRPRGSDCVPCMGIGRRSGARTGAACCVICMPVRGSHLNRHVVARVRVFLSDRYAGLIRRPFRRPVGLSVAAGARRRADQQETNEQPTRSGHVNDPEADDSGVHQPRRDGVHASSADVAARQDWTRARGVAGPSVSAPRLRDR